MLRSHDREMRSEQTVRRKRAGTVASRPRRPLYPLSPGGWSAPVPRWTPLRGLGPVRLLPLALALSLAFMATRAEASRVAVLLSAKVNEYEEALKGFKEAAPHEIAAVYDMDGDPERGRKYLAEIETKVKPDLIFAVGIWALQAVVSRPVAVPVVYAMVLNPPSIVGADAKNVTG